MSLAMLSSLVSIAAIICNYADSQSIIGCSSSTGNCNVRCDGNPYCVGKTINCAANRDCIINCYYADDRRRSLFDSDTSQSRRHLLTYSCSGSMYGCCDSIINCAADKQCDIDCSEGCSGITVHAETASGLYIKDCNRDNNNIMNCNDMNIYCPQNGATDSCEIQGDLSSYAIESSNIYTTEGFDDLKITTVGMSNTRIYCGINAAEYSCISNTNGVGCDAGEPNTICNTFKLPTPEPTMLTGSPTASPSTQLPTTDAPTLHPITTEPTTDAPTSSPSTQLPTSNPVTSKPTTDAPTASPSTKLPTLNPVTSKPTTDGPTTAIPTTSKPATDEPSIFPTTHEPSASPTTDGPSISPTTSNPTTSAPVTSVPATSIVTTSKPTTSNPTTSNPTSMECLYLKLASYNSRINVNYLGLYVINTLPYNGKSVWHNEIHPKYIIFYDDLNEWRIQSDDNDDTNDLIIDDNNAIMMPPLVGAWKYDGNEDDLFVINIDCLFSKSPTSQPTFSPTEAPSKSPLEVNTDGATLSGHIVVLLFSIILIMIH